MWDIICQTKEGIVFAFTGKNLNNELQDLDGSQGIAEGTEGTEEISVPSYQQYSKEK